MKISPHAYLRHIKVLRKEKKKQTQPKKSIGLGCVGCFLFHDVVFRSCPSLDEVTGSLHRVLCLASFSALCRFPF